MGMRIVKKRGEHAHDKRGHGTVSSATETQKKSTAKIQAKILVLSI
jgi:hypothetical protein